MKNYFPITKWLPQYNKADLPHDISAGVVVGVLLVPQGMAYAMIAGLPPVYGLYAALVPQVIYAILGTSRQLSVGPVAMDSLLVAAGLSALSISGIENYISMAILLALIMGVIQLLMGLFRLGFIVNYLSKPVISGFTSAAAIIIALSQLKYLLGVELPQSNEIHYLVSSLFQVNQIHVATLTIGLVGILILLLSKRYLKGVPGALLLLIVGIVVVHLFQLQEHGVSIIGAIPEGLPQFSIPSVTRGNVVDLLPIAATLALISFTESISVSKAVEENHDDYQVDANQELIALGSANIIGSMFQSYNTTGGFSRTAVNESSGAKTNLAAIVSALVIGFTLLFLTPLFYYLPHAVLASIIMVAVMRLVDIEYPLELYRLDKLEFSLLIITLVSTLFIGIKEGILIGVFLSLLLTVYKVSIPHIAVLGQIKNTDYYRNIHRFDENVVERDNIFIFRFDAPLFFGNKDYFYQHLMKEIDHRSQVTDVVINAESMNYIDSSAIRMMYQLIDELKKRQIEVYFSTMIGPVRDALSQSGFFEVIGEEKIFVRTSDAVSFIEGEDRSEGYSHWIASQTEK